MLIDGLELLESSSIINLVVPQGNAFPFPGSTPDGIPNVGELFYLTTGTLTESIGLYYYDGTAWQLVVSGSQLGDTLNGSATITLGTTMPPYETSVNAQLFYKADNTGGFEQGLYVFNVLNTTQNALGSWENVSSSLALTGVKNTVDGLSVEFTWLEGAVATGTTSTQIGYLSTTSQDVQTQLNSKLNRTGDTLTGNLIATGVHKFQVEAVPANATDVTNKAYVDGLVAGLSWKNAVQIATTTQITLSGEQTIDGVLAQSGSRVLVKSQFNPAENGIYIVDPSTWSRASDADTASELNSAAIWVEQGSTQANTGWTTTSTVTTLGSDAVIWTQFNGASGITAGIGLAKDGNTLSVNLGAGIAQLPSDEVGIDLYPTNSGLFLTLNGTGASSSSDAQLAIKTFGSTLSITADGLQVASSGITEHEIATSALTTGLTGGGGSKIGLSTSGVTAGTGYNHFNVDEFGRVTSANTVAYLTGNQTITLSGDASGSGTTSITITLADTIGGSAGSFGSATQVGTFTVDSKGRITAAGNTTITPAFSSLTGKPTTLSGYGITDAQLASTELYAIAGLTGTGWLKRTGPSAWTLVTPTTLAGFGITDGQLLNSILTSISGLSTSTTGLLKLSAGIASLDTSTYLTSHPATSPQAATSVSQTGLDFIQGIDFDAFGHATSVSSATIPSSSTSQLGVVQLYDNVDSTSSTTAATANAVHTAYVIGAAALARTGGTMTGDLILNADPTQALQAVTKQYVDNIATGLDFKASVRAATTANITLSGTQSIDGIVTDVGDRVLVKNQTTAINNGIYVVAAGAWSRASDADTSAEVTSGLFVYVEEGSTNAATGWVLSTTGTITLNTTPLTFTQFNGLAGITAGNGLTASGNTISVLTADADNITVGAGGINLAVVPGISVGPTFNNFVVDAYGRVTATSNTAYIVENQAFSISGDISGSYGAGSAALTLTLPDVNTSGAGSYTKVTVNAKGLVTSATTLSVGDVPNLPWSKITSGLPTTLAGYGISDAQPLDDDLTAIASLTGTAGFLKTNGAGTWTVDTATYLTGNQSISLSGDATGTGTTSISVTLANTAVAANSYGSATQVGTFTVDSKGRLTAASNVTITPAFSSLTGVPTTISGYGITDAQPLDADLTSIAGLSATSGWLKKTATDTWALVSPSTLAGFGITDAVNVGGSTMTGLLILSGDPIDAMGAATKQYVDNAITGLDFKQSVAIATTGSNIALSGLQIIDGYTVAVGDRVLVKDQTTASENGIYIVALGAWTRATDADQSAEVSTGLYTFVEQGTINGNTGWLLSTPGAITIGTTALTFSQFTGLGEVNAGAGVTKTGNTIDVNTASSSRIVVNADNIDLATTSVTAASYGDASNIPNFTVDAYGRLTAAGSNVLSSTNVAEGTKLFFTNSRAIGASLTGFVSGAGTVSAADTILSAIEKLDGNVSAAVSAGVTSVSVASANGFAGSSSGGTTPTITISTSVTGLLKGNGTAISAAVEADVTALLGAGSITDSMLSTTSVVAGSYGSATQVATFTVDTHGRLSAAGNITVTPAYSSLTGVPANLTTIAGLSTAGTGLVKLTAGVATLDTNTYLTSYTETDTLASVTGRGASTSVAVALNGGGTSTTPTAGDNTTKIATTEFVTTAISVIDGGSF